MGCRPTNAWGTTSLLKMGKAYGLHYPVTPVNQHQQLVKVPSFGARRHLDDAAEEAWPENLGSVVGPTKAQEAVRPRPPHFLKRFAPDLLNF